MIPGLKTPNIVHFIFGLVLDGKKSDKPWSRIHTLAVMSVLKRIPQAEIIIWFGNTNFPIAPVLFNKQVTMRCIDTPQQVTKEGQPPKKILKIEHAADVLKLQIIHKYGGIYLDIDTLVTKPFDDLIEKDMSVMCQERDFGLCNAVIIAPPENQFIEAWRDAYYDAFEPNGWGEASVQLPAKVKWNIPNCPFHIGPEHILPQYEFFYPDWADHQLDILFNWCPTNFRHDGRLLHLWESKSWTTHNIGKLTLEDIQNGKGLYHREARKIISA